MSTLATTSAFYATETSGQDGHCASTGSEGIWGCGTSLLDSARFLNSTCNDTLPFRITGDASLEDGWDMTPGKEKETIRYSGSKGGVLCCR